MVELFQQDLSGLVKALRANKRDEKRVIATALDEIRQEVRSKDWDVKAAAVLKLTYLEMLGHPTLIQHSFPVIECMASSKFHIKQIGYLAASQSFGESTEVILLANNLIKKDLTSSSHPSTVILALCSLPTLLTASPQLAADLLPDLLRMLSHSRPQVRRIATLVIGKIWASPNYTIPVSFNDVEKLQRGLESELSEDPGGDQSVVNATVNVCLELAREKKESRRVLLGLAPQLFELLTSSSNNWMLIKIVKLFALLTPVEPRLVRKLLPPLTNLINNTPAFSLLYECIQTVITGGMLSNSGSGASTDASTLASTCISKLSSFLSDNDQNLRYIALKGLSALLQTDYSHLLVQHYDEILECIDEEDITIRLKTLELIENLTDRSNCKNVVTRLLAQVSPTIAGSDSLGDDRSSSSRKTGKAAHTRSAAAALRAISSSYDTNSPSGLVTDGQDEFAHSSRSFSNNFALISYKRRLLLLILALTSRSSEDGTQLYINISNFEWYVDILVSVGYLSQSLPSEGGVNDIITARVAEALLDVSARAHAVREGTMKRMQRIVNDDGFSDQAILGAAGFILSEYSEPSSDCKDLANVLFGRAQDVSKQTGLELFGTKLLAKWLSWIDGHWEEEDMQTVKEVLSKVQSRLRRSDSAEGGQYAHLLSLVAEGMSGPRRDEGQQGGKGREEMETSDDAEGGGLTETEDDPLHNPFALSESEPAAPTTHSADVARPLVTGPPLALTMLYTIFFSTHALRPLASGAQALVPVPDRLDLDIWICPPPPGILAGDDLGCLNDDDQKEAAQADVDEYGRPKVSQAVGTSRDGHTAFDGDNGASKKKKKKAKDSRSGNGEEGDKDGKQDDEDYDSIPIVKLDLSDSTAILSPPSAGIERRKVKKGKTRTQTPSPPPLMILAAEGDAPVTKGIASVNNVNDRVLKDVKGKGRASDKKSRAVQSEGQEGEEGADSKGGQRGDDVEGSVPEQVSHLMNDEPAAVKVVKAKKGKKGSGSGSMVDEEKKRKKKKKKRGDGEEAEGE